MARHKVKLAFIVNNAARKATYKKRKQGLLKKMLEITTLCDVQGCVVIYSPYEAQPVAWPSPEEAKRILIEFKELPEMDQFKKMYDHEDYMRGRIKKDRVKIDKIQRKNREIEVEKILNLLMAGKGNWSVLKPIDLSDIVYVADKKKTEVYKRIHFLEKNIQEGVGSSITGNVSQGNSDVIFGFNQSAMVQSGAMNFAGNVGQGNSHVGLGFNQTVMGLFETVNFAGNVGQGNPAVGIAFNPSARVQSEAVNSTGNVDQGNPTVGSGFNQTALVQSGEMNFDGNVGQGNSALGLGFNQTAMVQSGDVIFAGNSGQGNPTMGFGFNQTAMVQIEAVNFAGNVGQGNPTMGFGFNQTHMAQNSLITQSEDEVSYTELLNMADSFLLDGTEFGSGSTSNNVAGQEVKKQLDLDWANRFK